MADTRETERESERQGRTTKDDQTEQSGMRPNPDPVEGAPTTDEKNND